MGWTQSEFEKKHPLLARSLYVVEASSFSHECLRKDHCKELNNDSQYPKMKWELDSHGETVLVLGHVDGHPVEVAARVDRLDGVPVCFYHGSSRVVDHQMLEKFFDEVLPGVGQTDAMNFGHLFGQIDKLLPIALAREEAEALEASVKLSAAARRRGL